MLRRVAIECPVNTMGVVAAGLGARELRLMHDPGSVYSLIVLPIGAHVGCVATPRWDRLVDENAGATLVDPKNPSLVFARAGGGRAVPLLRLRPTPTLILRGVRAPRRPSPPLRLKYKKTKNELRAERELKKLC